MGPAEPVPPVYSTLGSAALGSAVPGADKRAAPAKRVALATRSITLSPRLQYSGVILLTVALAPWAQGLTLLSRMECSATVMVYCSLDLQVSSDPPTSVSLSAGIIGWSVVTRSCLTVPLTSGTQAVLPPQPPEYLGLQACATMPGYFFLFVFCRDGVSQCCLGRFDETVIEERRQCAEDLLQFSANIPALYNSKQLEDFFKKWGLTLLPRMVSNSWVQMIFLPRSQSAGII
ncbi:Ribosomal protein S6 kinase delta-1, partial [Plecturocebus cupreus]